MFNLLPLKLELFGGLAIESLGTGAQRRGAFYLFTLLLFYLFTLLPFYLFTLLPLKYRPPK